MVLVLEHEDIKNKAKIKKGFQEKIQKKKKKRNPGPSHNDRLVLALERKDIRRIK